MGCLQRAIVVREIIVIPQRSEGICFSYHRNHPLSPSTSSPGIEVDILAEGELDLTDETLAQLDIVVASVHSRFDQPLEVMTARVLRALENPYVRILGHPHRP